MIWIIDDDEIYQFTVLKKLEKNGYKHDVQSFLNPEDALVQLKKQGQIPPPNVILLDINMPQMDGWEFLEKLRALAFSIQNLQIFMVSSSIDHRDIERAKNSSLLKGYFSKPLDINAFLQKV